MEDKCQFCRGNLRKKTISLDLWRKEKLYVFKNVPAKVCDQCNEKYFSSKIYGVIDSLLKENLKPDETMVVPVLSLRKFAEEIEATS
ncbi:MAG: type II toxin-antitoxin system MqsA family antitoxin [Euryarchaeota archaeon]|nr:type II toxin-antitoxin system MqsA family antitoxin [Euryarchaeota archaeon]MBU4220231.1 type II toxin-antitoxin system MqsA family antitoxin [Euryarchaeota archaeon]MBU4340020.1 type II toxin-antitoxin system MqsA family antitoxin [Euryarchaeota archaeon]MCG2735784.1 type II toxin-antitoxin system MqsA family antitoxin [Candidatus Methanoperedenaceae archaeon]